MDFTAIGTMLTGAGTVITAIYGLRNHQSLGKVHELVNSQLSDSETRRENADLKSANLHAENEILRRDAVARATEEPPCIG